MFWKILEDFGGKILEHECNDLYGFEHDWKILEDFGCFWRLFWTILEDFGIFWKILEDFGRFWRENVLDHECKDLYGFEHDWKIWKMLEDG